jgi:hypothetical protein
MKNGYEQIVQNMQTRTSPLCNRYFFAFRPFAGQPGSIGRETAAASWNVSAQGSGYNRIMSGKTSGRGPDFM